MGQINCQECTFSLDHEVTTQELKKLVKPYPQNTANRINILSKNIQTISLPNRKYSIQTTTEESEELSIEHKPSIQQRCYVSLQNQQQSLKLEIQKGKKVCVGTSKNCHVVVNDSNGENKFKLQLQYTGSEVIATDKGIGMGSYTKSSSTKFNSKSQQHQQVFMIENKMIRLTVNTVKLSGRVLQITFQDIQSQKCERFQFDSNEIVLKRSNKGSFQFVGMSPIHFEVRKMSQDEFEVSFLNVAGWKYLKYKTAIAEGEVLRLGYLQFRVKQIGKVVDSPDNIKIID